MIHQLILQKRLEQLKARQLREAEKEKAELAAVLAMQAQDVDGDMAASSEMNTSDTEDPEDDLDQEMGEAPTSVPYDRAMSPEPFDALAREDQNLAVVDQGEDWAEIVSDG
jgi:hypothetical protein